MSFDRNLLYTYFVLRVDDLSQILWQQISLCESHPSVINKFMALSLFYRCRCPQYISIDVTVTFQLFLLGLCILSKKV